MQRMPTEKNIILFNVHVCVYPKLLHYVSYYSLVFVHTRVGLEDLSMSAHIEHFLKTAIRICVYGVDDLRLI